MVSRKWSNQIQIFGFIAIVVAHIVYAGYVLDVDITRKIMIYAIGSSVLAAICLLAIKSRFWSEIGFIAISISTPHIIGEELHSLPYSLVVYMLLSAGMIIIGSCKFSSRYIAILNVSIFYDFITHYQLITQTMRIEYYVLLILFFETMLLATCVIVMSFQQTVREIEERNQGVN